MPSSDACHDVRAVTLQTDDTRGKTANDAVVLVHSAAFSALMLLNQLAAVLGSERFCLHHCCTVSAAMGSCATHPGTAMPLLRACPIQEKTAPPWRAI